MLFYDVIQYTHARPFSGHYASYLELTGTASKKLEDFVVAKFYCVHAKADGISSTLRLCRRHLSHHRWYYLSTANFNINCGLVVGSFYTLKRYCCSFSLFAVLGP